MLAATKNAAKKMETSRKKLATKSTKTDTKTNKVETKKAGTRNTQNGAKKAGRPLVEKRTEPLVTELMAQYVRDWNGFISTEGWSDLYLQDANGFRLWEVQGFSTLLSKAQ